MTVAMQPHQFAELFPPMVPEEFESFKASVREKGVVDPVVRYKGKCLDGLNRQRAVLDLNAAGETDPRTGQPYDLPVSEAPDDWTDADALDWVMQHNMTRRHLNQSQRAAIGVRAARLAGMLDGRKPAKKAKKDGESAGEGAGDGAAEGTPAGGVAKFIAARVGASERIVQESMTVEKERPALLNKVINGEMPSYKAYAEIKGRGAQNGTRVQGAGGENGHAETEAVKAPPKILDGERNEVDPASIYVAAFQSRDDYAEFRAMIKRAGEQLKGIADGAGGKFLNLDDGEALLKALRKLALAAEPHVVCPECEGRKKGPEGKGRCKPCEGHGYMSAAAYRAFKKVPPDESTSATKVKAKAK